MPRLMMTQLARWILAMITAGLVCAACASKVVAPDITPTPGRTPPADVTPAARETTPATEVVVLDPATLTVTQTVHGNCWTGSIVSGRSDAWRCSLDTALASGANLLDPCYIAAAAALSVVCPTNFPDGTDAIEVDVSQPLGCRPDMPSPGCGVGELASGSLKPVSIELEDGVRCSFIQGATFGVNGERANFSCTDTSWLVGDATQLSDGAWAYQRTPTGITGGPPQDVPLVGARAVRIWEE